MADKTCPGAGKIVLKEVVILIKNKTLLNIV